MKIKNFLFAFNGSIILLTLISSSCNTTNNVISSNFIQKRKYCNGYYITLCSDKTKANEPQTKNYGEDVNPPNLQIKNKTISAIKKLTVKEIQIDNSSDFLASTDDNTVTKQERDRL